MYKTDILLIGIICYTKKRRLTHIKLQVAFEFNTTTCLNWPLVVIREDGFLSQLHAFQVLRSLVKFSPTFLHGPTIFFEEMAHFIIFICLIVV